MKFQKQLEAQLMPEWRKAYVNYKQLKKDINNIRRQIVNIHITTGNSLVVHYRSNADTSECMADSEEDNGFYATDLVGPLQWTDHEEVFFFRLDSQLNVVNKFYKAKEKEVISRGNKLESQLQALQEFRLTSQNKSSDTDCIEALDLEECVGNINAENMLRKAFIECYKGLTLLQNYSSLNTLAFAKILKKYDKVTGRHATDMFVKAVESSYISTSNKVVNLMDRMEGLFTRHFSRNDSSEEEALSCLRPSPLRRRHSKSKAFTLGFFSWLFLSLVFTLAPLFAWRSDLLFDYLRSPAFKNNSFPIFSTLGLLVVHMYMYGLNVRCWRKTRVNYAFIFEFSPATETELTSPHRGFMFLCTTLTALLIISMIIHLTLATITLTPPWNFLQNQFIPLAVFLLFVVLLVMPFNICCKSTRFHFFRCLWRIVCAPFYKVEFSDFFLADQLTSQILLLRNMQFMICLYLTKRSIEECSCGNSSDPSHAISTLQNALAGLPCWWRLMQCVRRWMDERQDRGLQVANGGKYLSALVALLLKFWYQSLSQSSSSNQSSTKSLILFGISSGVATVYQYCWDIFMDWGLLQRNSANPYLRDHLILKTRTPYFLSMVVNAALRLLWMYWIVHDVLHLGSVVDHVYVNFLFAVAEIVRRGIWNFFRVENEHLNNVGRFRAAKNVPLPFKEIDEVEG